MTYNPDNWLLSASRELHDYVMANVDGNLVMVEMNFPDVQKLLPLPKILIHMEMDAVTNPVLGFGTPGVEAFDDTNHTWQLDEAQLHILNFDVGVWVSRERGGATARMQTTQQLIDLFSRPTAKKDMLAATGGLYPENFVGGRNEIDWLNDIPVWRALDMTLTVRVVSRHVPLAPEVAVGDFAQDPQLTTTDTSGGQSPVT